MVSGFIFQLGNNIYFDSGDQSLHTGNYWTFSLGAHILCLHTSITGNRMKRRLRKPHVPLTELLAT